MKKLLGILLAFLLLLTGCSTSTPTNTSTPNDIPESSNISDTENDTDPIIDFLDESLDNIDSIYTKYLTQYWTNEWDGSPIFADNSVISIEDGYLWINNQNTEINAHVSRHNDVIFGWLYQTISFDENGSWIVVYYYNYEIHLEYWSKGELIADHICNSCYIDVVFQNEDAIYYIEDSDLALWKYSIEDNIATQILDFSGIKDYEFYNEQMMYVTETDTYTFNLISQETEQLDNIPISINHSNEAELVPMDEEQKNLIFNLALDYYLEKWDGSNKKIENGYVYFDYGSLYINNKIICSIDIPETIGEICHEAHFWSESDCNKCDTCPKCQEERDWAFKYCIDAITLATKYQYANGSNISHNGKNGTMFSHNGIAEFYDFSVEIPAGEVDILDNFEGDCVLQIWNDNTSSTVVVIDYYSNEITHIYNDVSRVIFCDALLEFKDIDYVDINGEIHHESFR